MKLFIVVKRALAMLSCLLISHSAFAGLIQYTYSSKPLEWQKTFIGGTEWDEEIIHEEDGKVSFQFSFTLDDALFSSTEPTKIFISDGKLVTDTAFDYDWWIPGFSTSSNAKVIINSDGTIDAWSLIFKTYINDFNNSELIRGMTDHRVYISTQGGRGTCNCDYFQEKINFVIERPAGEYMIASYGDATYKSNNSLEQWKTQRISVPEPNGLLLMALSLFGIAIFHRRKNFC